MLPKTNLPMIYIASPYTHKYKKVMKEREQEVTRVAAELVLKYGYCFYLPITQSAPMERIIPSLGGSFAKWKDIDLEAIRRSDGVWVVMLDGWKDSVGVCAEIEFALAQGKEVRYIDPFTSMFTDIKSDRQIRGLLCKNI